MMVSTNSLTSSADRYRQRPRPGMAARVRPWYHEPVFDTCRGGGRLMVLPTYDRGTECRDNAVSDRVH